MLRHFQWFFHILPCCIFGHSGSVWNNWFNLTSKNHVSFTKKLQFWHKYQFYHFFYRILCKTGSEIFSSILSLMLVFMGCLGISDLRNPGQWYCSEGDKDRKKFFFKEIFLFEVKNIFQEITLYRMHSLPSRYCWIFANLRHCDVNFCVMLHCILCNKILCWKHCI